MGSCELRSKHGISQLSDGLFPSQEGLYFMKLIGLIIIIIIIIIIVWGTRWRSWLRPMLQAGSSRVRFPMKSLDFSIDLILPALWSTQPLTKMSTRSLPGGKGRPARGADNLAAICEPIV
jgi:hypothetical protein